MKQYLVAGLAGMVVAGGLISAAPPASAGCLRGGGTISRCDGPVQPDGTWQRCVVTTWTSTDSHGSSHEQLNQTCQMMGPDQHPLGLAYYDPPTHIDD